MSTEQFAPGFRDLVPQNAALERVAGGFTFTEGPVWNGEEGSLVWTEIIGDAIYKYVPGQGTTVFMSPSGKADGMTPRPGGPPGGGRLEQPQRLAVGA